MTDDDTASNPHADGHLPVSGEFDTDNPQADDSTPLNTDRYEDDEDGTDESGIDSPS
ncbi:hypothetical protein JNJ66_01405 [Candidatus Saccharibacteria bacterium]|nr:hypothetical protein [Candidatus Saccharibacteria bacterium]